jgi:uncharacterized membrane protein YhhN
MDDPFARRTKPQRDSKYDENGYMTVSAVFSVLAAASGVAAIIADHRKSWKLIYLFRPLTMLLIIAVAANGQAAGWPFKLRILLGLAACLAGDIFMMLEKKKFVEGLIAFLLGHLFYISAFLTIMRPRADLGTALPLLFFAGAMMTILFPHLGRMKVPVAFYILVITVMAGLAIQRFVDVGGAPALRAFLGALLFLASDSVLAVNRFVRPVPAAQKIILGTYFAAQLLFALSV